MDTNIKKIVDSLKLPTEGIDLKELERCISEELISQALARRPDKKAAAKLLNMGRTTFVQRCIRHNLM